MIKKLRRKFVFILMSVVTLILVGVFIALLFSSWSTSSRRSEEALRQAIHMKSAPQGQTPPQIDRVPNQPDFPNQRGRMPVLVANIDKDGNISFLTNQLYFIDEESARSIIEIIIDSDEKSGVLRDEGLRFLKSDGGFRIAIADISIEQEMLKNLILNSLLIGVSALLVFFFISLMLARWAVRPVEQAWEKQRRFVADASHELKTPLTVILSNMDMIVSNGAYTDEKQARRIGHIQAESVRMKKLVEDLLVLAKSDSVENKQIFEQVDLSFLVKSTVLAYESITFDEQKRLDCNIDNSLLILGNSQRIEQLINILLDNAVKYCPVGGAINVTLKEAKGAIILEVANDGEPIPEKELDNIFERFYRVDESRSDSSSFGLGLSIAQSIVAEHEGKIWAENNTKAGNRFYVAFPAN